MAVYMPVMVVHARGATGNSAAFSRAGKQAVTATMDIIINLRSRDTHIPCAIPLRRFGRNSQNMGGINFIF